MTATESAETLTLYQLTLLTAFFTLLLPLGWVTPTPADALWIVFNGASNAVGQYWWTRALHLAPASAVAPFYYLSLIWASVLGFAVWDEIPYRFLDRRLRGRGGVRPVPDLAREQCPPGRASRQRVSAMESDELLRLTRRP